MSNFNPVTDIPDLKGKAIFITGGTAGIGFQTVLALAAHKPSQIFFTGRSISRAEALLKRINAMYPSVAIKFLEMDHESLASIQAGVQTFLSSFTTDPPRLDILICNAGVMALPQGLTKDNYELQLGTNFLSHALLYKLLHVTLLATASKPGSDVRVILLSGLAYSSHPLGGIQFDSLKTTQSNFLLGGPWQRYGQSKLALILYASELSRRFSEFGLLFLSIHPGTFNTDLIRKLGMVDKTLLWVSNLGNIRDAERAGEGAWNVCWAATTERKGVDNGGFYVPVGVKRRLIREGGNEKLAGKLWEWTEKELEGWN